ncbi:cupin domain-containing protein [Bradyrhizobium cenepequi]|uniref:cupin domain-containing protein n=1 Tax=Bradyrhizobium cenepequi TaxID=2821403 RepID=UPI001CE3835A|nr:cupin domain-containing protein [Bradyrhizobium cenepequi]MCA6111611.1 cupin domain-containing protein [Bradyrhizobium cenepequi]
MNQKDRPNNFSNSPREDEWSEVTRGERYLIRTSSEDTDGAYSMLEIVADPRNGVPMHVHDNEEEHFIILEGRAFIANGDSRVEVGVGSSITIGRGVPHAWCNLSEDVPLRMLVLFSPGGLEELFRRNAGTEPADMIALAEKFGTRITGSALFDNLYTISSPRP